MLDPPQSLERPKAGRMVAQGSALKGGSRGPVECVLREEVLVLPVKTLFIGLIFSGCHLCPLFRPCLFSIRGDACVSPVWCAFVEASFGWRDRVDHRGSGVPIGSVTHF